MSIDLVLFKCFVYYFNICIDLEFSVFTEFYYILILFWELYFYWL